MNKLIDRTKEIVDRLRSEGRVVTFSVEDSAEINKCIRDRMIIAKREYIIKSNNSRIESSRIILD
jgi:ABC-type Na+ transport system ATPase subunit NatA